MLFPYTAQRYKELLAFTKIRYSVDQPFAKANTCINCITDAVVAFSVGLSSDQTVGGGSKVVFDQLLLDLNQVYDRKTGDFVAPVGGLYEFNFHALGQLNHTIWLELYKNYL